MMTHLLNRADQYRRRVEVCRHIEAAMPACARHAMPAAKFGTGEAVPDLRNTSRRIGLSL